MLVLTPFAFAEQLSLKKVSDLKVGDIIVDSSGNQIPVETIQETNYKISTNLIQILTGKLSANPLTGNIIVPITGNAVETTIVKSDTLRTTSQQITDAEIAAKADSNAISYAQKQAASQQLSTGVNAPPTSAPAAAQTPVSSPTTSMGSISGKLTTSYTSGGTLPAGTYSSGSIVGGGQTVAVPAKGTVALTQNANGEYLAQAFNEKGVAEGAQVNLGKTAPTAGTSGVTSVTAKEGSSAASKFLGISGGGWADALVSGAQWAVVAYFAAQMLGPMFGLDEKQTDALSYSLAAGALVGKGLAVLTSQGGAYQGLFGSNSAMWSGVIGVAVAAVIFIALYKDTKTETITFSCLPWQAPTSNEGGKDCEVCNEDTLPCSEYRCKSLGQACELVNAGTGNEKCVYVNPKDVTPPVITPNPDDLPSDKYKYTNVKLSPPGPGFTITNLNKSDGCVPAFTPLTFGITTDEPSQCKIDFNHTTKIDDMSYYFGGSNLYLYNHTEQFSLPGPANLKKENLTLENGGKWTFYIRCQDKNGNANEAEYALRFCVDPTPDTTAPVVKVTSLQNEGCIPSNRTSANVDFYLNEPSTCRWSRLDQSYDNMQGNMTCSNRLEQMNAQQLYTCSANLDGVARDGTEYFVRCMDNAGNKMAESFKYSLRGSTQLLIKTFQPNETVYGGVSPAPIELFVQTNYGCDGGKSICFYSQTGNLGDFYEFYDTNKEDGISTQKLFLTGGAKTIYVRCVDSGGNLAESNVNFNVEIDVGSPIVARAYEEDNYLKIVTVRDSECAFTNDDCSFLFEEGTLMPTANTTTHVTEWTKDKTYYIKCRDEYRNSDDASCSVVVKPTQTFF
jgi:hypothetical protein